jgi:hypothetical protein
MIYKRAAVGGLFLALALVCLRFGWSRDLMDHTSTPDLVITFAGLTNAGARGTLARFEVANVSGRRLRFGVGELQNYKKGGWPPVSTLGAGTDEWQEVTNGSHVGFSVRVPVSEEARWRVPLIYQKDRGMNLLDQMPGIELGNLHWRWRSRYPVCRFVVGPEMVGSSKFSETR